MSRRVKVDMTGVESFTRCPEGEWFATLKKIEQTTIQGSGDDGLKAQFEVIKGEAKGCSVFETFSLTEKALWKLKSFLDAIGMKSSGRLSLDLDKLEGKTCIIDVTHNEYNGTKRANITAYLPITEDNDDDDEDEDIDDEDEEDEEEEAPKKSAKKPAAKKTTTKKAAPKSKKRPEPEEDEDEDDDEDDEDDDDEEPVKPKKATKKAPAKTAKKTTKKTAKKPEPEEDEDEDDDDDDWEDDED